MASKKLEINREQRNTNVFDDPLLKSMLGCGDATIGIRQAEPQEVPVALCYPWHDAENSTQPFHLYSQDKLRELACDMAVRGLDYPIIVRPYETGYQILAGHNRVEAAKLISWDTILAKIVDVDDDDASLILVNTNLYQREKKLPSEKARAYQIQMKAMTRKAGRPSKENGGQVDHHFQQGKTLDILAEQSEDSAKQIQRYTRLNLLLPNLLDMVDMEQIPFTAGVALSYLSASNQKLLLDIMEQHEVTSINGKQAECFKSRGDTLTDSFIRLILGVTQSNDPPAAKPPKPITIKIPAEVWGDLPPSLAKDAELMIRIKAVIEEYVSTHNRSLK